MSWFRSNRASLLRGVTIAVIGLAGTLFYADKVSAIYPIETWLVWPMAALWGWTLLLNAAWLAFGQMLLVRVFRQRELPLLESCVMSAAVGVIGFTLLMYAGGALALFGPAFAVALPLGMLALGARDSYALFERWRTSQASAPPLTTWSVLLLGAGAVCVALVYLGAMTPDAINYDATWYHLPIAQDYAREGRIVPFPADYPRAYPHLTSIVYTWGFCVPGLTQVLRWMMALHLEFSLFLWTLAGVGAAVRWLTADERLTGGWVAFFLFPIIFVYDSNLGGSADHVCAFFVLPLLLACARLLEQFDAWRSALLGAVLGGVWLTKYQAIYFMPALGLVLGLAWGSRALALLRKKVPDRAAARRQLWVVPAAFVATCVLVVSPHFLKNILFHGNPVYPFLQATFTSSRPTVPNGVFYFDNIFKDINWVPKGSFGTKLYEALKLSQLFSFEPHYTFTKNVPAMGSLFTLMTPMMFFVAQRRRKLLAFAFAFSGLIVWSLTFLIDRHLQVVVPVFAAFTGAVVVDAFRAGAVARVGVVAVVAMQVIWGGDALFYSAHDRIRSAMDLIRSGYEGGAKPRFDRYRPASRAIDAALPKNAKVLLHTGHVSIDVNRELIHDWAGFQGLVSYDAIRSAEELLRYYQKLGVTHVIATPGQFVASSRQEEVVYHALISRHAREILSKGGYRLYALPKKVPAEAPYRVAVIQLLGYGSGVFPVERLNTNEYLNRPKLRVYAKSDEPLPDQTDRASWTAFDAVLVGDGAKLDPALSEVLKRDFVQAIHYSRQFAVYVRKASKR